jgi:hypothetical protein
MSEPFGSFAALKNMDLLAPDTATHFKIEKNLLVSLLAQRIAGIRFDEPWYLTKNPDVRDAVKRGTVPSAKQHYVLHGYYEHRMPAPIQVNEKWYIDAYPDVAKAIQAGIYKSAQAHFDIAGFREGRLPFANFEL